MEALKTFLTGIAAIVLFAYILFIAGALGYTVAYGFDWYTLAALPGWTCAATIFIMALGSFIRGEPNRSDWY